MLFFARLLLSTFTRHAQTKMILVNKRLISILETNTRYKSDRVVNGIFICVKYKIYFSSGLYLQFHFFLLFFHTQENFLAILIALVNSHKSLNTEDETLSRYKQGGWGRH